MLVVMKEATMVDLVHIIMEEVVVVAMEVAMVAVMVVMEVTVAGMHPMEDIERILLVLEMEDQVPVMEGILHIIMTEDQKDLHLQDLIIQNLPLDLNVDQDPLHIESFPNK